MITVQGIAGGEYRVFVDKNRRHNGEAYWRVKYASTNHNARGGRKSWLMSQRYNHSKDQAIQYAHFLSREQAKHSCL